MQATLAAPVIFTRRFPGRETYTNVQWVSEADRSNLVLRISPPGFLEPPRHHRGGLSFCPATAVVILDRSKSDPPANNDGVTSCDPATLFGLIEEPLKSLDLGICA